MQSRCVTLMAGDITYDQMDTQAQQVAAWVAVNGFEQGQRIGIYMPDHAPYLPAALGIWRAGCVATPINARFGTDQIEFVLKDAGVSGLLTNDVFTEQVDTIHAAEIDGSTERTAVIDTGGTFNSEALPDASAAPAPDKQFDNTLAILMHTSGTTGQPKGVKQTHRNIESQVFGALRFYHNQYVRYRPESGSPVPCRWITLHVPAEFVHRCHAGYSAGVGR